MKKPRITRIRAEKIIYPSPLSKREIARGRRLDTWTSTFPYPPQIENAETAEDAEKMAATSALLLCVLCALCVSFPFSKNLCGSSTKSTKEKEDRKIEDRKITGNFGHRTYSRHPRPFSFV
jgi:hypothetical protein